MCAIRELTAVRFGFACYRSRRKHVGKGASVLPCKPPNPRRCNSRPVRSFVKKPSRLKWRFAARLASGLCYANRKGTACAAPFLLAYHEGFVRSTKCDGIAKTAQLICEQSRAGAVERQPRVRIPQGKKKGTERVRCLWRTMRDSNPRPSGP